jgi:hypothetical protein
MKNQKIKSVLSSVLLASLALVPVSAVLAEESGSSDVARPEVTSVNEDAKSFGEQAREDLKKSEEKAREDLKDLREASSTASSTDREDDRGSKLSEEHKNRVSEFTKKLLEVGKRDWKMKKDVEDIANETLDSGTSTAESIDKENSRSAWKTFLIGSDFQNLGKLRSELARTDKIVERLNVLASSTANTTVQIDLEAQIKLLQDAQAKVKTFVTEHESSFSLFGWFVKIFNK